MTVKNIQQTSFTKIEIAIAKHIFKHFKDKYNARQLSRILGINPAHTNKLCNLLATKRLLLKEELGNSAYFTFNHKNEYAMKFMEYLLSLEENGFPKWMTVPLHELKTLNQHIKLGLVFGSSIKNKDFNDIDVLLMYDPDKSKDIQKTKENIRKSQLIDKPIRYVDISDRDITTNIKDEIFYNILSESLLFHNPEKYAEIIKSASK